MHRLQRGGQLRNAPRHIADETLISPLAKATNDPMLVGPRNKRVSLISHLFKCTRHLITEDLVVTLRRHVVFRNAALHEHSRSVLLNEICHLTVHVLFGREWQFD